jgi:hypothetical protein
LKQFLPLLFQPKWPFAVELSWRGSACRWWCNKRANCKGNGNSRSSPFGNDKRRTGNKQERNAGVSPLRCAPVEMTALMEGMPNNEEQATATADSLRE